LAINLAWTDASNNETSFRVERKTGAGAFAVIASSLPANTTSYTDNTGLVEGTSYTYRVCSVIGAQSACSNEASATAPTVVPNAPTGLTATASNSALSVVLMWTDASSNETGFRVERKTGAGGTYAVIANNVAANATTYTDSDANLALGTQYFYKVCAVTGAQSTCSGEASATTLTLSAPTNLTVTPATTKAMNLTWSDVATNETGYSVSRATTLNGTYTTLTTSLSPNATSYVDSDASLTVGGKYFYRVCATLGTASSCATSAESTVTSVETRLFEQSISLYPNPTQNAVFVKFDNKAGKQVEMRLLDLRGKEVRAFLPTSAEMVELNLAKMPKGVYLLELRTERGTVTKRVVKN
jgi:hypothetical protein